MKTTTKSFLLVAIVIGVAAIMIAPTALAYFSATSSVEDNLFTAGTISLSVDGEIPLEATLTDLKPCMNGEGTITVTNDGTNPFDLWVKIENVVTANGVESAAEFAEDPTSLVNDIDGVMRFDLKFGDIVVIDDGCDYTISDGTHQLVGETTGVKDKYVFVGNFLPQESIDVTMSFMMDGATTNWAQGDTMNFDVTFYALQSEGNPPAPTPELVIPGTCPTGITAEDMCGEQGPEGLCVGEGCTGFLTIEECDADEDLTCLWNDGSEAVCSGGDVCTGLDEASCTDTVPSDLSCTWTPEVAGSCSGVENTGCALEGSENDCETTLDYTAYCIDPYDPVDATCPSYTTGATCVEDPDCAWFPDTYCQWVAEIPGSCAGVTGCDAYTDSTACNQLETTDCDYTPAGQGSCSGDAGCESLTEGACETADEDIVCEWISA